MKSVITQGSTIAKAIEEALKKSDAPQEFFVKVLEDAQSGFLGFGAKKAKIALFFKNESSSEKTSDSMLAKGSYLGLFNNPGIKKQIDQQLKELGLEIKPIKNEQVEKKVVQQPKQANMQVRPLHPKPQQSYKQQEDQQKKEHKKTQPQEETLQQYVSKQLNSSVFDEQTTELDQKRDENQSGQARRRRYYRYRRNRHRNKNDQQQDGSSNSFISDVDNSKKDE